MPLGTLISLSLSLFFSSQPRTNTAIEAPHKLGENQPDTTPFPAVLFTSDADAGPGRGSPRASQGKTPRHCGGCPERFCKTNHAPRKKNCGKRFLVEGVPVPSLAMVQASPSGHRRLGPAPPRPPFRLETAGEEERPVFLPWEKPKLPKTARRLKRTKGVLATQTPEPNQIGNLTWRA